MPKRKREEPATPPQTLALMSRLLPEDLAFTIAGLAWDGDTSWIRCEKDVLLAASWLGENDPRARALSRCIDAKWHHLAHRDWYVVSSADAWCSACLPYMSRSTRVRTAQAANALLRQGVRAFEHEHIKLATDLTALRVLSSFCPLPSGFDLTGCSAQFLKAFR